jgi:hypothetical protein
MYNKMEILRAHHIWVKLEASPSHIWVKFRGRIPASLASLGLPGPPWPPWYVPGTS